jgi:hypothetical protein
MDPIPIVVERLMSASEKSSSETFLLSALYKGLLLSIAGATSFCASLLLNTAIIDCRGEDGISKSSAELYCRTRSYTIMGVSTLYPGM